MTEPTYDYDGAISYLARDEAIASQIRDALLPLNFFIYPKAQEEVAGAEGVAAFRHIFRDRSRISMVLFRPEWGQTKWTRVEETAIRDHCLDAGWDHLIFVRLTRDGEKPKWVPDSYIYLDFTTFGLSDLVGLTKSRFLKLGIELRVPTAADRAKAIAEQERFNLETLALKGASPKPFHETASTLFAALDASFAEIERATDWKIGRGPGPNSSYVARLDPVSFVLLPSDLYTNTCEQAHYIFRMFRGAILTHAEQGKFTVWERPQVRGERKIIFTRMAQHGWCWEDKGKVLTTEALASTLLDELMAARERERQRSES